MMALLDREGIAGGPALESGPPVRRRQVRPALWLTVGGVLLLLTGLIGLGVLFAPEIEYSLGTIAEVSPLSVPPASAGRTGASELRTDAGDRIVVPRLGVDVPIGSGNSEVARSKALRRGAWWHAGTAEPGEGGNTVLAGHRVRKVFSPLRTVKRGDLVLVSWRGAEYRYRVDRVFTVTPEATRILSQEGEERLTLYTCIPRTLGNRRTVVVALPE